MKKAFQTQKKEIKLNMDCEIAKDKL
jgi:hypothetical protein